MSVNKGAIIKELRLQSRMTLEEVGEHIGVSKQTLYKYENNIVTNIPSDKVEKLANLFNVSPAVIMGWEPIKDTPAPTEGYYSDPEVAEYAEELRTNPNMRLLFSAAKNISKKDMEKAVEYITFLKSKEQSDNDFSE